MSAQYEPACGYLLCFAFFWLLLCMDNIQTMLENPFLAAAPTPEPPAPNERLHPHHPPPDPATWVTS